MAVLTVRQLLTFSIYLSGLRGAGLNTPIGDEITYALTIFNNLIAERNDDGQLLPYYQAVVLDSTVGTVDELGTYSIFVPGLVSLETFGVLIDNDLRLFMYIATRDEFFNSNRVMDVAAIPYSYFPQRVIQDVDGTPTEGVRIYTYFAPQEAVYRFQLTGRFSTDDFTLDSNIYGSFGQFYVNYLQYKVASRLCQYYQIPFSQVNTLELIKLERKVTDINAYDLSMRKVAAFPANNCVNPGSIKFSGGWGI